MRTTVVVNNHYVAGSPELRIPLYAHLRRGEAVCCTAFWTKDYNELIHVSSSIKGPVWLWIFFSIGFLMDYCSLINTLRQSRNGQNYVEEILKCVFLDENIWISINISLKFMSKGPLNNIPALVQIMAWHRPRSTDQATSHYLNQWWQH